MNFPSYKSRRLLIMQSMIASGLPISVTVDQVLGQGGSLVISNPTLAETLQKRNGNLQSKFGNIEVKLLRNAAGVYTFELVGSQQDIPVMQDERPVAHNQLSTPADLHIGVATNFTNFLNDFLRDNVVHYLDIQNSVGIGRPKKINGIGTKGKFTQRMTATFQVIPQDGRGRIEHLIRVGSMFTQSGFHPSSGQQVAGDLRENIEKAYAHSTKIDQAKQQVPSGHQLSGYTLFIGKPNGLEKPTADADIIILDGSQCIANREDFYLRIQK